MVGLGSRIAAGEQDPLAVGCDLGMEVRLLAAAVRGPRAGQVEELAAGLCIECLHGGHAMASGGVFPEPDAALGVPAGVGVAELPGKQKLEASSLERVVKAGSLPRADRFIHDAAAGRHVVADVAPRGIVAGGHIELRVAGAKVFVLPGIEIGHKHAHAVRRMTEDEPLVVVGQHVVNMAVDLAKHTRFT